MEPTIAGLSPGAQRGYVEFLLGESLRALRHIARRSRTALRARWRIHALERGRSGEHPTPENTRAVPSGGGGLFGRARILRLHAQELIAMAVYFLNMKTFGRAGGSSA